MEGLKGTPALRKPTGCEQDSNQSCALHYDWLLKCIPACITIRSAECFSTDEIIKMFRKRCQRCLTFPFQIIAVVNELQRVRLIRSLNVVHVDVQVVGRFQEVIGQHRPLALIQGEVHVRGDQSATLALSQGLTHIEGGGRIWTGRQTTKI